MKHQIQKFFGLPAQKAQPVQVPFSMPVALSALPQLIGCLSVSDPWIFQGEGYVYPAKQEHPSDVQNETEKETIESILKKKWMTVYEDGSFRPNSPVSRESFLYVTDQAISKTLGEKRNADPVPDFPEIDKVRWSRPAIEKLATLGLLESKKSLNPSQNITRIEAISLLAKAAQQAFENKALQVNAKTWLFLDLLEQTGARQTEAVHYDAVAIGRFKTLCPAVSLSIDHPATLVPDALLTRAQLAQLAINTQACLEDSEKLSQKTASLKSNEKTMADEKSSTQTFETACDVVVSGGTLAGVATALAAAQNGALTCLLEPFGYPAGYWLNAAEPQTTLFFNSQSSLFEGKPHYLNWFDKETASPCKKDTLCMIPDMVLKKKLEPLLQKNAKLFVLSNTQVKALEHKEKLIRSLQVSRAAPAGGTSQKIENLLIRSASAESPPLFVETSPIGSLFVHSGDAWLQGLETLNDKGLGSDLCGSSFGFPVLIPAKHVSEIAVPELASRAGIFNGKSWSGSDLKSITQQNSYNIEFTPKEKKQSQAFRYVFFEKANIYAKEHYLLSREETIAQMPAWKGGINLKAIQKAKENASNWLTFFENLTKEKVRLVAGYFPGGHAVPEWPRISDGRRSIGIGNYLLGGLEEKTKTVFETRPRDEFFGMQTCSYPRSIPSKESLPESIGVTLESITNRDALNLLAAGPALAANFAEAYMTSNSEGQWKTGVLAGTAAAMLSSNNKKTTELLEKVEEFKDLARITWEKLDH